MNSDRFGLLAAALSTLPAQKPWEEVAEVYELGLLDIPDEIVPALVREVVRTARNYRPTVAQILETARHLAGIRTPHPSEVVEEIERAVARYGLYGRQVPGTRRYEVGAPPLSPMAQALVDRLGGWAAYCSREFTSRSVHDSLVLRLAGEVTTAAQETRPLIAPAAPPRQIESAAEGESAP